MNEDRNSLYFILLKLHSFDLYKLWMPNKEGVRKKSCNNFVRDYFISFTMGFHTYILHICIYAPRVHLSVAKNNALVLFLHGSHTFNKRFSIICTYMYVYVF